MPAIEHSPLGREVAYPQRFDAGLLYPIPRAQGRAALGIAGAALPFVGNDRWHAYELSWLDARGKPQVATATFEVPADSPNLIESKSFKLYLNSCNAARFPGADALRMQVEADLSAAAGAPVAMAFGLWAVVPRWRELSSALNGVLDPANLIWLSLMFLLLQLSTGRARTAVLVMLNLPLADRKSTRLNSSH